MSVGDLALSDGTSTQQLLLFEWSQPQPSKHLLNVYTHVHTAYGYLGDSVNIYKLYVNYTITIKNIITIVRWMF